MSAPLFVGESPLSHEPREARGSFVDIAGERFYRIENVDAMPPFLMSLVSPSDHWMFLSSHGGLTVGRRDPDHALFPYVTDDRIHDGAESTGPRTLLRVARGARTSLWEPLSSHFAGLYRISRHLAKSVYGNAVVFEEVNHDLELTFRSAWMNGERFGFVRRAEISNDSSAAIEIELLDGLENLLPHGITRQFQLEFSTLGDGYKDAELEAGAGLGLFRFSSIPTDKAEPSEALAATTVWCEGLGDATRLLSSTQVEAFRRGQALTPERRVRGRRGAYFVNRRLALGAGEAVTWHLVADVDQDAADVAALLRLLNGPDDLANTIREDLARGTEQLVRIVANADGLQTSSDEASVWRHFSNTLFNVMRGGTPAADYSISRADFGAFLSEANRAVAERHAQRLGTLPERLDHGTLVTATRESGDADLERLGREYMPLTFSRRHGDPSRPWNIFSISVKDERGHRILAYQGNWRDIFQNWEALAHSFPGYVESMIFKFLDASTADGHNPYRVTREGFDWEAPDPNAPWANIGYWGDHQTIYLLKLLELSARAHPGALMQLLGRRVFTYANVPYRIRSHEEMLRDPHDTIVFDAELHRAIGRRLATQGTDARLLMDAAGQPCRATLADKLLLLPLARLFSFVPEAGIWMNTQRPEWNDANNALVGNGVSAVTLCYLRRFLSFVRDLLARAGSGSLDLAEEIAAALASTRAVLHAHLPGPGGSISDGQRRVVLDALGAIGSRYRAALYAGGLTGRRTAVSTEEALGFCDLALNHVDHSIRANRREDGLYHAYNLMQVAGQDALTLRRLPLMLEGQVAVLSSGTLPAAEAAELLDALRASALYRADQNSYVLYPDRELPGFLERNRIPRAALEEVSLVRALVERDDRRLVVRDVEGGLHFAADLHNARFLTRTLDELAQDEAYTVAVQRDRPALLALYERLFDHHAFTGRSGTFYKYEGLGCIYWHMVSKLRLAVQECQVRALEEGAPAPLCERLLHHYVEIREGIGAHKSPPDYGAVPTDPYSHTPGFAGVQQPGMTGQVKEDILARLGELGVAIEEGCLRFRSDLLDRAELLAASRRFRLIASGGEDLPIDVPADSLVFTFCQVPVVLHAAGPPRLVVTGADGSAHEVKGLSLDADSSAAVFGRTGSVRRLDVHLGL